MVYNSLGQTKFICLMTFWARISSHLFMIYDYTQSNNQVQSFFVYMQHFQEMNIDKSNASK